MRKMLIAATLVALVALVAGPATAGGNGKGRGGGSTTGSLSFSDPVMVGADYQVSGSGFPANTWISVGARFGTTYWGSGPTDSSGRFSFTFSAESAGQIVHDAYVQGNNGRWRLATSATVSVYAS